MHPDIDVAESLDDAFDSDPVDTAPAANPRSLFARHGLGTIDVLMLFSIVIITCGYMPLFSTSLWTPRMLTLLIALPPGMVALAALAVGRSRSARWAIALIGWTVGASFFSDSVAGALIGFLGQQLSALTVAAAFGMWALARYMSPHGQRLAAPVTLTCLAINALVGIAQVVFTLDSTALSLDGGRATGLSTGSIQFGAFMALGIILCSHLVPPVRSWRTLPWLAAAFAFGSAVAFSGSRVAVAAAVVFGVVAVAQTRHATSVTAFVVAAAGMAAARLFDSASTGRLGTADGGDGRMGWLKHSVDAVRERPVVGWGFGRFRDVEQPRMSFEDARVTAGVFENHLDPHNFILAIAVAIGIPGLVIAGGFAARVMRRSEGAFLLGALAIAATWVLQPMALTTLPLVLIMLGLAHRRAEPAVGLTDDSDQARHEEGPRVLPDSVGTLPRRALIGATVLGLVAAGWLATAEVRLKIAYDELDPVAAEAAVRMYPADPIANNFATALWKSSAALLDPTLEDRATESLQRNIDLEPNRALWWVEMARWQGFLGDLDGATASARQALELQPTHERAWNVLAGVAEETGDEALLAEATESLCQLGVEGTCD